MENKTPLTDVEKLLLQFGGSTQYSETVKKSAAFLFHNLRHAKLSVITCAEILHCSELQSALSASRQKVQELEKEREERMLESKLIEEVLDETQGWQKAVSESSLCPTLQSAVNLQAKYIALTQSNRKIREVLERLKPESDCPFCGEEPCSHCMEMARIQRLVKHLF